MKRIVFDTNQLVLLSLQASEATRLFLRLQAANWEIVNSPAILEEVSRVMHTKKKLKKWLGLSEKNIEEFLTVFLPVRTRQVRGVRQAHGVVQADPDDDKIVAAALEGEAGYILTEDQHLLDLKEYEGIQIMNREQFAQELDRLGIR